MVAKKKTRAAAKKTTAKKKVAAKKTAAKKAATTKADPSKPTTKSEAVGYIAERTGLTRKDVNGVFEELETLIKRDLNPRKGPGVFTIPNLMKIKVNRKPATKARRGINPFTGEETVFKAKPARNVVKVQPLKNLKDMV